MAPLLVSPAPAKQQDESLKSPCSLGETATPAQRKTYSLLKQVASEQKDHKKLMVDAFAEASAHHAEAKNEYEKQEAKRKRVALVSDGLEAISRVCVLSEVHVYTYNHFFTRTQYL